MVCQSLKGLYSDARLVEALSLRLQLGNQGPLYHVSNWMALMCKYWGHSHYFLSTTTFAFLFVIQSAFLWLFKFSCFSSGEIINWYLEKKNCTANKLMSIYAFGQWGYYQPSFIFHPQIFLRRWSVWAFWLLQIFAHWSENNIFNMGFESLKFSFTFSTCVIIRLFFWKCSQIELFDNANR